MSSSRADAPPAHAGRVDGHGWPYVLARSYVFGWGLFLLASGLVTLGLPELGASQLPVPGFTSRLVRVLPLVLTGLLYVMPHHWTPRGALHDAKRYGLLLSAAWLCMLSASLVAGVLTGRNDPAGLIAFCAPALAVAVCAPWTLHVRSGQGRGLPQPGSDDASPKP